MSFDEIAEALGLDSRQHAELIYNEAVEKLRALAELNGPVDLKQAAGLSRTRVSANSSRVSQAEAVAAYKSIASQAREVSALKDHTEPASPKFIPPQSMGIVRERAPMQDQPFTRNHDYRHWDPDTTRVVSGPIGSEEKSKFPGRRFPSRRTAREHWQAAAGIVDEHIIPGRYIFRIKT